MKKKTLFIFTIGWILLNMMLSGCNGILSPTIYESSPTKIKYDISYGYLINSTGTGRYEITYQCYTPDVLIGTTTYQLLNNKEYQTKTLLNNTFIQWNISGQNNQTYELGLIAHIESKSYLVPDLKGENALTTEQIISMHPDIIHHYTRLQANETIRFIDPYNSNITAIAQTIQQNSRTNNSFLLAKALFVWLKENVEYQTHQEDEAVQPAATTLYNKTGDCDDLSFLYISLCRSLSIPARLIRGFLLTNYENGTVVAIRHAWVEVFVGESVGNNGWIPVECACCTTSIETDIHQNFGVENAFHLRLFVDDGSNASLASLLSRISYITYGLNRSIELQLFAEIQNYQELELKNLVITNGKNRYYE